jgi:proline iminopeptidase
LSSMPAQSRILPVMGGTWHVWTRRVGASPVKALLLHGGPGANHEYLECFEDHLPPAGVELYFYDQLGSYYSDQPDDPSLWTVDRFREEVEEVRRGLGLQGFYLIGQSWGGMLGIEYALAHPDALKALVISNMTASIAAYTSHLAELRSRLPADVLKTLERYEAEGAYEDPEYQRLLTEHLYNRHICRRLPWPDAVQRGFAHINPQVYNTMQGPNEFVVTGTFKDWDRWDDLNRIEVPTLLIVGRHDSMRPSDIEEMGRRMPRARVVICEEGSHLACWDDPDTYFGALLTFIRDVEAGRF